MTNTDFAAAPSMVDVQRASERIRPFAVRTPLLRLNHECARPIFLKLENLQPVGSFKIRCAANALLSRPARQRQRGFATASAGNFAQGLAFAARALDVPVTAIVPETAARSKIDALKCLDAEIIELPYADWWQLLEHPPETFDGKAFIHPVTDPYVIAGNGTIGLEILQELPDVHTIIAPYGGGGLSAGVAAYVKAAHPSTRILACETEAGCPLAAALAAGEPREVSFNSRTFVTGMGSRRVLDSMWPLVRSVLDGACSVSLAETARAIRLLISQHHIIAEGAGAAPVAAAMKGVPGEGAVVAIVSGGHLDPKHIVAILEGSDELC